MKGEERQIRRNAGLTLIEVLVVMGIVVLLIGLGLLVSMDAYRGYIYRHERLVLVSVLEKARSRAMNNIHQTAWGACYDSANKQYIIFQDPKAGACAANADDDTIPANPGAIITIAPLDKVVFAQLSGRVLAEQTVTLTESGHAPFIITINTEGTIIW